MPRFRLHLCLAATLVALSHEVLAQEPPSTVASTSSPDNALPVPADPQVGPSTGEKVFTCYRGYTGPSLLGWCRDGSFYGGIHVGAPLVYANARTDVYAIGQVAMFSLQGCGLFGPPCKGKFKGLFQVGLVASAGDFVGGVQSGGLYSTVNSFSGLLKAGGFASVVSTDFRGGAHVGLGTGTFGRFTGVVQVGVVFNFARQFRGLAMVGLVNFSDDAVGIQLGGINRARLMKGLQIGLYNSAEVLKGLQVGVVNRATNGLLPTTVLLNAAF